MFIGEVKADCWVEVRLLVVVPNAKGVVEGVLVELDETLAVGEPSEPGLMEEKLKLTVDDCVLLLSGVEKVWREGKVLFAM